MSIYELQLDSFNGISFDNGTDPDEQMVKKLLSIKDLRKKIDYYNKNIESLSACGMAGQIYVDNGTRRIKIYCGCKDCRVRDNFNPEHEKVFWELKSKEVDRLKKAIHKQKSYKEKLGVLLSTKGYQLTGRFRVYPNVDVDLSKEEKWEIIEHQPVIDLTPNTKQEIKIYNEYVRSAFEKKYLKDGEFTEFYYGFRFKKEKERFERALSNSMEPKELIEYVKSLIDKKFDYPNCIYGEDKQSETLKEVNRHLEENGFLKNLFPRMVLGIEIDLDKYPVNNHTLWEYTHISEVVKFYDYLRKQLQIITFNRLIDVDPDDRGEKNKSFTTARQVLAIHYLLKYTNVQNIDATEKARFVQFLTGKETGTKKISDTTIYKKINSPLSKDNKTLLADLQYIRTYFENLGLMDIVNMINNEIEANKI